MIKVVMFDLGQTLIDRQGRPFPHVRQALTAIFAQNLKTCLVSDFDMNLKPARALAQYVDVLASAGLLPLFEPVNKRVTLSNHAGVLKPDQKIFEKALQRLGASSVPFAECLLITEDAVHVKKVREELGMQALEFGVDFTDWSEAPAKIAALSEDNTWVSISVPGHEDLRNILVQVPDSSPENVEEARSYVRGLADNQQISGREGKTSFRPTHTIETDTHGSRRLVRKRFTFH